MSWLSDLFGGGKQTVQPQPYDTRTPQEQASDSALSSFISTYLPQYQPGKAYSGSYVAPMSTYETQAMGDLQKYMDQGTPQSLSDVQSFLGNFVNGSFNPNTSQQYLATRDAMDYNNMLATRDANAAFGARGKFFSTAAMNKIGDINAQTAIGKNQTMAQLADQFTGRQMQAAPMLSNVAQFLYNLPINKAQAGITIGGLPRELNQADLESQYQDFLRQQKELGAVPGASSGITRATMQDYAPPTLQRNTGQQTGASIANIAQPIFDSVLPFVMSLF